MSADVIRLTRRIEAPPEVVFSYLTSSERWAMWQGISAVIDAKPGGIYTMVAPNQQIARGQITEVVPDRRITFTWGWEGHLDVPPGSTTVSIEIEPVGSGTLVTLTHTGLPTSETDLHRQGWAHYIERLTGVAEGRDIGPDPGLGVG